jgi:hypothetical protein
MLQLTAWPGTADAISVNCNGGGSFRLLGAAATWPLAARADAEGRLRPTSIVC